MLATLKALYHDEDGATLVEYSILVALIAVVCIAAVKLIGTNANNSLNNAASAVK